MDTNMDISPYDGVNNNVTIRRCSNCRQPGHNRNNRNCPMYVQRPRRSEHEHEHEPTNNVPSWFYINNEYDIDPYDDVLERCKIISSIIAIVKDTIYEQLCRAMLQGLAIESDMNRNIFYLSSFSQTVKGIMREIKNVGIGDRKYFYMDRLQSLELLLKPIINNRYIEIIDSKIISLNRPDIHVYYNRMKVIKQTSNDNVKISIKLSECIDCSTYDCPICLNTKKPTTKCITNCFHSFCDTCIISHINHAYQNNYGRHLIVISCPLCRQDIKGMSVSSYERFTKFI